MCYTRGMYWFYFLKLLFQYAQKSKVHKFDMKNDVDVDLLKEKYLWP